MGFLLLLLLMAVAQIWAQGTIRHNGGSASPVLLTLLMAACFCLGLILHPPSDMAAVIEVRRRQKD